MIIGKKKIISKANVVLLDCWLASPRRGVRQFQLLTSIINSKYCSKNNAHVKSLFSNFRENIPLNMLFLNTKNPKSPCSQIPNRVAVRLLTKLHYKLVVLADKCQVKMNAIEKNLSDEKIKQQGSMMNNFETVVIISLQTRNRTFRQQKLMSERCCEKEMNPINTMMSWCNE